MSPQAQIYFHGLSFWLQVSEPPGCSSTSRLRPQSLELDIAWYFWNLQERPAIQPSKSWHSGSLSSRPWWNTNQEFGVSNLQARDECTNVHGFFERPHIKKTGTGLVFQMIRSYTWRWCSRTEEQPAKAQVLQRDLPNFTNSVLLQILAFAIPAFSCCSHGCLWQQKRKNTSNSHLPNFKGNSLLHVLDALLLNVRLIDQASQICTRKSSGSFCPSHPILRAYHWRQKAQAKSWRANSVQWASVLVKGPHSLHWRDDWEPSRCGGCLWPNWEIKEKWLWSNTISNLHCPKQDGSKIAQAKVLRPVLSFELESRTSRLECFLSQEAVLGTSTFLRMSRVKRGRTCLSWGFDNGPQHLVAEQSPSDRTCRSAFPDQTQKKHTKHDVKLCFGLLLDLCKCPWLILIRLGWLCQATLVGLQLHCPSRRMV